MGRIPTPYGPHAAPYTHCPNRIAEFGSFAGTSGNAAWYDTKQKRQSRDDVHPVQNKDTPNQPVYPGVFLGLIAVIFQTVQISGHASRTDSLAYSVRVSLHDRCSRQEQHDFFFFLFDILLQGDLFLSVTADLHRYPLTGRNYIFLEALFQTRDARRQQSAHLVYT
jgi:hypothetical protein